MAIDDKVIRKSEMRRIFTYYGTSALTRKVYFDFFIKNWNELLKKYKIYQIFFYH